ncbi:B12-binding domain-containing radical SAM protein [Micromonospora sp. NPDC050417]|uniref:B12-binding domain-containing radical SAM protein n=1 Tax=Micromonospora sp. NPDC050417 TaxID=3364280 RepID=UPI00378F42FE
MNLEPVEELVSAGDTRYNWTYPVDVPSAEPRSTLRTVWYVGLPLTSAHRGSHSGGGALIDGAGDQARYANEGTVYPHASLVEMITYQSECFPELDWRYLDLSHLDWHEVRARIQSDPPDVAAFTVYSSTAMWAYIVAAEIKRVNPAAVVVFGNDHAGILHREVLSGTYGSKVVDFVCTGNNGPFTMMGLLSWLQGKMDISRIPSLAYRGNSGDIRNQAAPTYPLSNRRLPDYRLIEDELANHYDDAFRVWYASHYDLKRMVTLPLDGGCNWGRRPTRRCLHCSIQGLTPKTTDVSAAVSTLEVVVGELKSNVYAAGDSTLGMSQAQWGGNSSFLDDLAAACADSEVLRGQRFMLAYGLVYEFLQSAELCKGFVKTWNVGIESFDPKLLKGNSKGINKGPDRVIEALDLAKSLDYKMYLSGILGLPGTTLGQLKQEVDNWLSIAEAYAGSVTTISVAAPAIIPGSRMYRDALKQHAEVREWHGELLPIRKLSELYIRENTEVQLADVEAALADLGRGVIALDNAGANIKFGGYMLGGVDHEETHEHHLLDEIFADLR